MPHRRSPVGTRRASAGVGAVLAAVILAGCAPAPSPDPALVALQEQALSLTRSAQLGTELRGDARMFGTTTLALLSDMETKLADVTRETSLHRPADATDAAYREELLDATLEALDAVQAAAADRPDAEEELDAAAQRLDDLGAGG